MNEKNTDSHVDEFSGRSGMDARYLLVDFAIVLCIAATVVRLSWGSADPWPCIATTWVALTLRTILEERR